MEDNKKMPKCSKGGKVTKGALQVVGGAIPVAGGIFSAIAGAWSEKEQERVNKFFGYWIKMLEDEIREKEHTMIEILARLDLQDEKINKRVNSKQYQSLVKKTFREWSGAESEEKRQYIRNILSNAAATDLSSDDVIRLFIDWINEYSELHFQVIGAIYNSHGVGVGKTGSLVASIIIIALVRFTRNIADGVIAVSSNIVRGAGISRRSHG